MSPARSSSSSAEPAHNAAIDLACRQLRLPTIRERCAEFDDAAAREQASYRAFLAALLAAECDDREVRRRARRVAEAGFPRPKRLDDFDFTANPNIEPVLIGQLATGAWVAAGQPLCLIGDSGTGKSHLLIALGTAAADAGHRVRYVTTAALVNELVEAADERQLSRTIARYGRVDLLCCDELGYLELDRRGAELLFQVFTEREERASVAIASNAPFSEWVRTFTDPRLAAAIIDRLTFDAHIIPNRHRQLPARARPRPPPHRRGPQCVTLYRPPRTATPATVATASPAAASSAPPSRACSPTCTAAAPSGSAAPPADNAPTAGAEPELTKPPPHSTAAAADGDSPVGPTRTGRIPVMVATR